MFIYCQSIYFYFQSNDPNNTDPQFLIMHNVTFEDAGWYGCMASNTLGNSTQNAYLNVLPCELLIQLFCRLSVI